MRILGISGVLAICAALIALPAGAKPIATSAKAKCAPGYVLKKVKVKKGKKAKRCVITVSKARKLLIGKRLTATYYDCGECVTEPKPGSPTRTDTLTFCTSGKVTFHYETSPVPTEVPELEATLLPGGKVKQKYGYLNVVQLKLQSDDPTFLDEEIIFVKGKPTLLSEPTKVAPADC